MRRLPPPPGFYLSKEHSYAQLCPLLWRRRYDQAIDCLEKALRQLHAARRRESRLRGTVLRLRDKQLKHTAGGHRVRGKASNQEESEPDAKFEDTGLFENRCVEQMELGGRFLPDSKNWPEEREYCFYCGRGQVQVGGQVVHTLSQPTNHEDSLKFQTSIETSTCDTARKANDVQIVRLGKIIETIDSGVTPSQILLHSPDLQYVIPTGVCLPDTHEQSLRSFASQQKLLLSDGCEEEADAVDQEHHLDLQQQQFWVHGTAKGHVILVSVSSEDGLQSFVKVEDTVPELALEGELEHMPENSGGVTGVEAATDEEHCDITSTSGERREDVREKLKEHLEGFHLQLSTEFLN